MSFFPLSRKKRCDSLRNSNLSVDEDLKYMSLDNRQTAHRKKLLDAASTLSLQVPPRKRILNRNGSISTNYFRGVHKHLLEEHAETVTHTMTVSTQ